MYFSYSLNDGRRVRISHEVFLNKKKNFRKCVIFDSSDGEQSEVGIIDFFTDEANGKVYFSVDNQKKYIDDYDCYTIQEMIHGFGSNDDVKGSVLAVSLLKYSSQIAFIMKKAPTKYEIDSTGVCYFHKESFKDIICVLHNMKTIDECKKTDWDFIVKTIPVDFDNKRIYGEEKTNYHDFYDRLCVGDIRIIMRSDIKNYTGQNKKVRRRKGI